MSSKPNRLKTLSISMCISLFIVAAFAVFSYNKQVKTLEIISNGFVQQIEGLKGRIFLFNQIAKLILSMPTKPEALIDTNEIYTLDYKAFLNSNGTILNNRLYQIFSPSYSWLDASALLYFKLFDSNTLLSDKPITKFDEDESYLARVFSDEYCKQHFICARFASKENLADKFIFGNIHVSADSGEKTLTIASPTIIDDVIVAESHIDVNLAQWELSSNLFISSKRQSEHLNITVSNSSRYSNFSLVKKKKVDNFVTMIFIWNYANLVIQGLLLFVVFIVFISVVLFYRIEKTTHDITKLESMTDALTGCYNRKILCSFILKNKLAKKSTNTVFAFDGNKIKYINDKFGHDIGDIAIVELATAIKQAFRKEDIVIRTGGDEFIVIALGLNVKLAQPIINEVNAYLAIRPVFNNYSISVSAGASKCSGFSDLKQAISNADIGLYANKRKAAQKTPLIPNLEF